MASIVLCGFPVSNYYNKVKLALLEKGVDFDEEDVRTGRTDEATLAASPLGKIPFLRTPAGTLCESQPIVEWIEAAFPEPPLLPAEPFAAAKVRELVTFVDLHLELVARELYAQAFFGGTVAPDAAARVRERLMRHVAGFRRLARFAPHVAGADFTLADCAAWPSLSLVAMATKAVYGEDLLAAGGIDWKAYNRVLAERPSVQRVAADRKAAQAAPPPAA
jgi:glutathione S-transferase